MNSILIKDTTKEQREQIVADSIGNSGYSRKKFESAVGAIKGFAFVFTLLLTLRVHRISTRNYIIKYIPTPIIIISHVSS